MNKTTTDHEKQLLKAVSKAYNNELAAIDPNIKKELDLMRHKAMARIENKPQATAKNSRTMLRSFQQTLRDLYTPTIVGGGLAALLALFIYTDMGTNSPNQDSNVIANNSDSIFLYELVLDDKPIDFYQQLAFVEWLDEEGQLLVADS